jgi:hypothetical protein
LVELVSDERMFDCIESTADPWCDWFQMLGLGLPARHTPLDAWIERDVEEACRAADRLRLAVIPTTKRFSNMWATFRRHHEQLDGNYKHRRIRWLVWRAAALTVICARNRFQDVVDANQARDKLAATMHELGPIEPDGSFPGGGNFWRVGHDSAGTPDPLAEYAVMVLSLVRAAARRAHVSPVVDAFKYNLLAERINELNAIQAAAGRADPELFRANVCDELRQAIALLTSWYLVEAEHHCERAERLFLAERRRLAERRSPPFKRLVARLCQAFGTPIGWENGVQGYVGMTDELQAAWDALEDFEYDQAERLAVKAERKARAKVLRAERAARHGRGFFPH